MKDVRTEELLIWINSLPESANLYIAGAGKCGEVLGEWLNQKRVFWKGYIDKKKKNSTLNNKEIYNSSEIKSINDYFIISSYYYGNEIAMELMEQGVAKEHFIIMDFDLFYEIYDAISDWKKYTGKIKQFRNCHKGRKRCFVIGNGPSLTISDLEKLQGEISFASNTIYAVYDYTTWRPNYYFMGDPAFANKIAEDEMTLKKIVSNCDTAFISVLVKEFNKRNDDRFNNICYIRRGNKIDNDSKLPCFSEECSEVVYASSTITYVLLQMAVYMGFNEIYLLGIDFSFSNEQYKDGTVQSKNISNHMELIEKEDRKFNEMAKDRVGYSYLAYIDMQKNGYLSAKKYADEHGIKIYNATRGGKLEVFERVDFDTLF